MTSQSGLAILLFRGPSMHKIRLQVGQDDLQAVNDDHDEESLSTA
jgi:hypothetical protein